MKKYTQAELMAFVNRADTHEKVATAEAFIKKLTYVSNDDYDDLMNALAYISRELYHMDRETEYEDEDYTPANPWAAPGMSPYNFVRGIRC